MALRAADRLKVVLNHLDRSGVAVVSFYASANVFTRGFFRQRGGKLAQGPCVLSGDRYAPELEAWRGRLCKKSPESAFYRITVAFGIIAISSK